MLAALLASGCATDDRAMPIPDDLDPLYDLHPLAALPERDARAVFDAVELETGRCMDGRGFEYEGDYFDHPGDGARVSSHAIRTPLVTDVSAGYPVQETDEYDVEDLVELNAQADLLGDAYWDALDGTPSDEPPVEVEIPGGSTSVKVLFGGCRDEGLEAVYGDQADTADALFLWALNYDDNLGDLFRSDEEYGELTSRWRSCMADNGITGYENQHEPAWEFREEGVGEDEVRVATIDAQCLDETGLRESYDEIRTRLVLQLRAEFEGDWAALYDLNSAAVEQARTILSS